MKNPFDDLFEESAAPPPEAGGTATLNGNPFDDLVETPAEDPNFFENTLNFFSGIANAAKTASAEEAAQREVAKREEESFRRDPRNLSSTAFKKQAPKPQTVEEQAIHNAIVKQKKYEEERIANELLPPELRKPSLEIRAPEPGDRPATKQEKEVLRKERAVSLAREMPGPFDRFEAFIQGIIPYSPEGSERVETLREAHPISSAAGQLTGLAASGYFTAGVAPTVTQMKVFEALPSMARMAAGRIAQTSSTFGLKALTDELSEMASGVDKSGSEITKKVIMDGLFGAGLGAVGSIPQPLLRIPSEAAYGFATAKLQGSDNLEAGINAAIFGAFGLLNRKNLAKEYRKAVISGFKKAIYDNLVATGRNPTRAQAFSERYFDALLSRSINEEKPLTTEFIESLTQKVAKATRIQESFAKSVRERPLKRAELPASQNPFDDIIPTPQAETPPPAAPIESPKTAISFYQSQAPAGTPEQQRRWVELKDRLDNAAAPAEARTLKKEIAALEETIKRGAVPAEAPAAPKIVPPAPKPSPEKKPAKKKVVFEIPKEVSEADARGIFFFDEGDTVETAILKGLREEIQQGEAGGRIYDPEGGGIVGGYGSTFPDYFKNKGYSQAETLRIISNVLDRKPITERQKNILADLVDGYIAQSRKEAEYYAKQEAELEAAEGEISEEDLPPAEVQKQDQGSPDDEGLPRVLEPGAGYSPREKSPPFYSQLEKTLEEKMPNSAPAAQVRGTLNSAGVKQEEMEWLDVEGFLQGKEKVSKQELLDYVRANQVQVKEVMKGGIPTAEDLGIDINAPGSAIAYKEKLEERGYSLEQQETKFQNYVLPGGENYRELLLTLPNKDSRRINLLKADLEETPPSDIAERDRLEREIQRLERRGSYFQTPHFDESNVLAHVRMNDRSGPNGEKILFIEEIQSDWHQKGRKQGYEPKNRAALDARRAELERQGMEAKQQGREFPSELKQEWADIMNRLQPNREGQRPPDAPFKKTWHELALKRMLRYAAENGYDAIAWTTGEQQAERYDLSKHLDEVGWKPKENRLVGWKGDQSVIDEGARKEDLEKFVGKDVAEKLINGSVNEDGFVVLSGVDLKVGGEGMKGFYDQIIPSFLNKYAKKWGGRVSETKIETPHKYAKDAQIDAILAKNDWLGFETKKEARDSIIKYRDFATRWDIQDKDDVFALTEWRENQVGAKVHSLEITPAMRESVLTEGQRIFEKTAKYSSQKQYELFSDEAAAGYDKLGSEGVSAYGSKEDYQGAIQKAVEALRGERGRIQPGRIVREITQLLKKQGFAPAIGREVKNAQDVAEVASIFRTPAVEIFQAILVSKSGSVLAQHSVSFNIPNKSYIPQDFLNDMLQKAKALGAKKVYFAHNHPSGDPTPSIDDDRITVKIAKEYGSLFGGHVVINGDNFFLIDRNGRKRLIDYKSRKLSYKLPSAKVGSPSDLAEIAKDGLREGKLSIVFTNQKMAVSAIEHVREIANLPETIAQKMRAYNTPVYAIVLNAGSSLEPMDIYKSNLPEGLFDVVRLQEPQKGGAFSLRAATGEGFWNAGYYERPNPFFKGTLKGKYFLKLTAKEIDQGTRKISEKYDAFSYDSEGVVNIPDDAKPAQQDKKRESILNTFNAFQYEMDFWDEIPPNNPPALSKPLDPMLLKDISNIQAGFMDIYRQFKHVFGDYYPELKKAILDPLDESRDKFFRMQEAWLKELETDIVKKLGIKKGSKESAAVQMYGEGNITDVELRTAFGDEKTEKIIKADRWFRNAYNELLERVNATRARIYPGKPEKLVPARQFYYRHFRDLASSRGLGFGGLMNIFDTPAQISSKLAGISPYTKPKSKWASFMQRRLGIGTEIDAVGGFLNYLPAAAYATHIDPNIPRFRTLAKELRTLTEDDPVINRFIESLEDFAGDLAGKTNPFMDRDFIKFFSIAGIDGRKAMRVLNWVNGRVKKNVVLGKFSSLVAQLFNIPQGIGRAKHYALLGLSDTLAQIVKPSEVMRESKFLRARFSDSMYDKFDMDFLRRPIATAERFAAWMMSASDEIATRFLWNSFYQKALGRKIENPVGYADAQTREVVAGRSVGEVPIAQKSRMFQLAAPFQIEVANLWWALREQAQAKDYAGLVVFLIASYLMNSASEKIMGRRVSFDPLNAVADALSGDKTTAQRIGRIVGEIFSNIPLGQTVAAIYPEYGFKVGDRTFPTRRQLFGENDPTRYGSSVLVAEGVRDPLFKLLTPFGGEQAKRSVAGVKAATEGDVKVGKTNVSVETDTKNKLIGFLFGPYALPEVREYFDLREDRLQARYMAKNG